MTKIDMHENIKALYRAGYSYTEDGRILSPFTGVIGGKVYGDQKYASISIPKSISANKAVSCTVPIYKYIAYCMYGDEALKKGIVVRHLDGNSKNNRPANLRLGTYYDNEMDKAPEVRKASAIKARAAQGSIPHNAGLSEQEVKILKEKAKKFYRSGKLIKGSCIILGKEFCVSRAVISSILRGINYGHIR